MPNIGQISLLLLCIALFAIAGVVSLMRINRESEALRIAAKACSWLAVFSGVGVLAWHAVGRNQWLPLDDNFEALIWLGLLLALSYSESVVTSASPQRRRSCPRWFCAAASTASNTSC